MTLHCFNFSPKSQTLNKKLKEEKLQEWCKVNWIFFMTQWRQMIRSRMEPLTSITMINLEVCLFCLNFLFSGLGVFMEVSFKSKFLVCDRTFNMISTLLTWVSTLDGENQSFTFTWANMFSKKTRQSQNILKRSKLFDRL